MCVYVQVPLFSNLVSVLRQNMFVALLVLFRGASEDQDANTMWLLKPAVQIQNSLNPSTHHNN